MEQKLIFFLFKSSRCQKWIRNCVMNSGGREGRDGFSFDREEAWGREVQLSSGSKRW